jgi:hypothetical protein
MTEHTLTDDGTLDTVVECTNCGERTRFSSDFDERTREAFVRDAIADANTIHECPHDGDVEHVDAGPPTEPDTSYVLPDGARFVHVDANGDPVAPDCKDCAEPDTEPGTGALTQRFRLYIGETTRDDVQGIVLGYVKQATIIPGAFGVWRGGAETCTIVEIIGDHTHAFETLIHKLAADLRDTFKQDCVLLTTEDVRGELI